MIDDQAIVSCYVDTAAILLMVLTLYLSVRLCSHRTPSLRVFHALCLQVMIAGVSGFVFYAMYRQSAPWCRTAAVVSRTVYDLFVVILDYQWLSYVGVKLYGERKQGFLERVALILPPAVFSILLIVNLFTGIVFTVAEDNSLQPTQLYGIMTAALLLYFCASALSVWNYDRKSRKVRFLHVGPVIISVIAALIPQFYSPYGTVILGFAIGITLLYCSMVGEFSFLDEESGLYNKRFLSYFFEKSLARKDAARSALILKADGNLPGCYEILRDTLHREGDVIRMDEKLFLMFSDENSRAALQMLSTQVEQTAEKYNREHPGKEVHLSVRCHMRGGNEDAFAFLRKVVEEKEEGDPIHGVVSMISELDRLDKELELAADIQVNMLPMVFPPYPDRTEFDLYASMTPAKEVGGDFYDFFLIDSDHLGLVIADVSGKGVPAALFMMVSKTLIKNQMMSGCDPATALTRVNLQLCERNLSKMFVTVWAAVLEISTGKGLACNAGHENPALRRMGGEFELLKYKHGMFAGVSKKAKYQNREFALQPGDCIFVYTDGVPEAKNLAKEMFREERLVSTLNQDPELSPEALIHRMHDAVDRFAGGVEQFDDITMLCVKYFGAQDTKEE